MPSWLRSAWPWVLTFLFAMLFWIVVRPAGTFFDLAGAIATAAAAYFAATSSAAARESARAAAEEVAESKRAREIQVRPWFTLTRKFSCIRLGWPEGHPMPLFRDSDGGNVFEFELTNHSDGPGLDIEVEFELEDASLPLQVPERFGTMADGRKIEIELQGDFVSPDFPCLQFTWPDGQGSGVPLVRKEALLLPYCAAGMSHRVRLPEQLLLRLLLRAMQACDLDPPEVDRYLKQNLVITVLSRSVDGASNRDVFTYEIDLSLYVPRGTRHAKKPAVHVEGLWHFLDHPLWKRQGTGREF